MHLQNPSVIRYLIYMFKKHDLVQCIIIMQNLMWLHHEALQGGSSVLQ